MAKLITVYWRDIPSQVIAKKGRTTSKVQLSHRFQEAIDRAAMRAGEGSSDAYLREWRREASTCSDDLEEAARETAAEGSHGRSGISGGQTVPFPSKSRRCDEFW